MPHLSHHPAATQPQKNLFKALTPPHFFLALILLLAVALRITGIQWGLPAGEHLAASYRPDEYSLFAWLRRMNPGQLDFNPNIYFNGTFLLFLLAGFYKLLSFAGILTVSSSPVFYYQHPEELGKIFWLGRLFMSALGVASVSVLYRAGSIAFNKRTGLIAALLLALTPLLVVSSKHMIVEPAAVFWFALATLYCLKIIQTGKLRDSILAGIVIGNACAVKINNIPWGGLLVLAHVLSPEIGRESWSARIKDKRLWISLGVSALAYFISNPFLLFNLPEAFAEISTWGTQYTQGWRWMGYGSLFSLTHLLPAGLGWPFFVWSFAACVWGIFSRQKTSIFLSLAVFLFFYIQSRTGTVIVKYHALLLPFLCLLSGAFLDFLLRHSPRLVRVLVLTGFAFMVLQTLALSTAYNKLFSAPDARDRASLWIQMNISPGKKIAVSKTPYDHSPPVIYNQFYFRGISAQWQVEPRYEIVCLEEDLEGLRKSGADYAVFSLPENRGVRRRFRDFSKEDSWTLIEKILAGQGFERIETFTADTAPQIDRRFPPEDWLQILTEIRIYKAVKVQEPKP